jgi:hypothetical protein
MLLTLFHHFGCFVVDNVILQKWEVTKKDEQLAENDVGADKDRDRDRKDITFLQLVCDTAI